MKSRRILIVLSILTLAALACNLGAGAGSPTDTPAPGQPTEQTSAPESTAPGSPASTLNLEDPSLFEQDLFNTYRTSMDYTFEAEGPITTTALIDASTQVEPYATTLSFYSVGTGLAQEATVLTITQVMDVQYLIIEGTGCQTGIPGVGLTALEENLDLGGLLTGEAQFTGEGTANEVDTYVYTLTQDNIDQTHQIGQNIHSVSNGEIHIARDGGYIVRLLLEGRGLIQVPISTDTSFEGDVRYALNFYDFGAPLTIDVPPECVDSGSGDSTYPIPDDASNISQLGAGVLTFSVALTPAEVAAFYEEAMPAHGCAAPTVEGDGTSAINMTFTGCEFGDVTVVILADSPSSSLVSVLGSP